MNVDIVYAEEFQDEGIGQAIMNRLLKSAGYKIIKAQKFMYKKINK